MTSIDQPAQRVFRQREATMELRSSWLLDGPNAWIDRPAIRLLLDLGTPSGEALARLQMLMSGESPASEHPVGESTPTHRPTDAGALLADVIMEMQQLAGDRVSFSLSTPRAQENLFDVVCECRESDLALSAAKIAVRFLNHLVYQTEPDFDLDRAFNRHVMWHIRYRDSQREQQATIEAARARGIPYRFVDKRKRLVHFGLGAYAERLLGIMTSKSTEVSSRIARNKPLAKELMRECGVPVPDGAVVHNVEEANRIVERLGYPVIVKPSDLKHGMAVTVGIRCQEELTVAVELAVAASRSGQALVETMIVGRDYRIGVVGDRATHVVERVPAHVIGDGKKTIAELIAIINDDPMRQPGRSNLYPIPVDDATNDALAAVGMTLDSVPEPGQEVKVKLVANLHQGGTTVFRTAEMHPDNALVARLAAKAVGLDVCGLDFIGPDISKSVWEVGGAVIEVNSEPQNRIGPDPVDKRPLHWGAAIMDMYFPPGRPYQPTMVAVVNAEHESSPGRMLKLIMRRAGFTVGLKTESSIEIDGPEFALASATDRDGIQEVARNPYVTGAIFEIAQEDLEERGLPFLQCDVAILGNGAPKTAAPGARQVASVVAGLVAPGGAIIGREADQDSLPVQTESNQRHILVSADSHDAAIDAHLRRGGSAVTSSDGLIVYRTPQSDLPILSMKDIGPAARSIAPVALLQAVAAGMAIGAPVGAIREAVSAE